MSFFVFQHASFTGKATQLQNLMDILSMEFYLIIVFLKKKLWDRCIFRICKYNKDIKALEETEKHLKEE